VSMTNEGYVTVRRNGRSFFVSALGIVGTQPDEWNMYIADGLCNYMGYG